MTAQVVTDRATRVLAPNPGPMTLDGTNTWILSAGPSSTIVIDPGPLDERHLRTVLTTATSTPDAAGAAARRASAPAASSSASDLASAADVGGAADVGAALGGAAGSGERRVAMVLLTHGHADHAEGAAWFAREAGCPVRALDPAHRLGSEGLADGDVVAVGDLRVDIIGTPGHTSDSLSFWLPDESSLLTGDTVLGRGTSVVAHPDGSLGAYLGSLRRLHALASDVGVTTVLPGHGPVITDALAVLSYYLKHRAERLDQVRAALASGARTPREVVETVYSDVDPILWPAAELSVRAQLTYLTES